MHKGVDDGDNDDDDDDDDDVIIIESNDNCLDVTVIIVDWHECFWFASLEL